jgi:hypothetical protein
MKLKRLYDGDEIISHPIIGDMRVTTHTTPYYDENDNLEYEEVNVRIDCFDGVNDRYLTTLLAEEFMPLSAEEKAGMVAPIFIKELQINNGATSENTNS